MHQGVDVAIETKKNEVLINYASICAIVGGPDPSFYSQVVTEGRLVLEFTFDDLMRIRSWHFSVRQHRELIPRSVIAMQMGTNEVNYVGVACHGLYTVLYSVYSKIYCTI